MTNGAMKPRSVKAPMKVVVFQRPYGTPTRRRLTARSATVTARHVGGGPGFVDEDQALGVEIELPVEPGLALLGDVGAVLLGSGRCLFLRVMA